VELISRTVAFKISTSLTELQVGHTDTSDSPYRCVPQAALAARPSGGAANCAAQIPACCCRSRPPLFTGLIASAVVMCFEQDVLHITESKVITSAGFVPVIHIFTSCAFYKWLFMKMLVLV